MGELTVNAGPQDIRSLLSQAHAALDANRMGQAEAAFRQVLQGQPNEPNALHGLGLIAARTGHIRESLTLLRRVTETHPAVAPWQRSLGGVLVDAGLREEAIAAFERCLAASPEDLVAASQLTGLLATIGRPDQAVAVARASVEATGASPASVSTLGVVLEQAGLADDAWATVEPLLGETPMPGAAMVASRIFAGRADRGAARHWLERALEASGLAPQWTVALHFALADLIASGDDPDRVAHAFRTYERANQLVRSPWDPNLHENYVDMIMSIYASDAIGRLPRATTSADGLVFILGMPRSGTSLVEQIIASHPQAWGGGEMPDVRRISMLDLPERMRVRTRWPRLSEQATAEHLDDVARTHRAKLRRESDGAAVCTDKMPSNALLIGLIWQLFPGARIIHCQRDPVDTCTSCYFTNFTSGNLYTCDLTHLGRYHVQHERLMTHWRTVLDMPLYDVSYESLVASPEEGVRALLEFCGLPWDEACMRHHESGRHVGTASYAQVRQPIYTSAVSKYEPYAPYLGPLREALASGTG